MNAETDDEWIDARFGEMRAINVRLRLYEMKVFSNPVRHNWNCEAIVNGSVYCCEVDDSKREAVAKTIATVMAARLQGLKLRDDAPGSVW